MVHWSEESSDTMGGGKGGGEGGVRRKEGRRGGSGGTSLAVASSASDEWRALARLLFAIRCDCQPGDSGDGRGWFEEERDQGERGWLGDDGGCGRVRVSRELRREDERGCGWEKRALGTG